MFSDYGDIDLINALLDSIPKNNYKPEGYFYGKYLHFLIQNYNFKLKYHKMYINYLLDLYK